MLNHKSPSSTTLSNGAVAETALGRSKSQEELQPSAKALGRRPVKLLRAQPFLQRRHELDVEHQRAVTHMGRLVLVFDDVSVGERFIFSNALRGQGNLFDRKTGAVHAGIMLVQAIMDSTERGHLFGDVPALFLVAIVLALLMPRAGAAAGSPMP